MKSWFTPIVCAAALALPMFSSTAQAGVEGKAYDITMVNTAFEFAEDEFVFEEDGHIYGSFMEGEYIEINFGPVTVFGAVTFQFEPRFIRTNMLGAQIGPYIIGGAANSAGFHNFYFGKEQAPGSDF